jgi:hypothetical protein
MGGVVNATLRPLYLWGSDPLPIVQGAVWAPETDLMNARKFAHTGIRSSYRSAGSDSLHELR